MSVYKNHSGCCKENGLKVGKHGHQMTNDEVTAEVQASIKDQSGDDGTKERRQI